MSLQGGEATHAFAYDTLGRLTFATDDDIGDRHLRYTDGGFLREHENAAGQTIEIFYDGAGRPVGRIGSDGTSFSFHYDADEGGGSAGRVAGRLAWVEEPNGKVSFTYDEHGRTESMTRSIKDPNKNGPKATRTATETLAYSPSGLVLSVAHDDDFTALMAYDPAGRPVGVSRGSNILWQVIDQDAAGRVLEEQFGNGVQQITDRDLLGQPSRIQIIDGARTLHDVGILRNAYGAATTVTDSDGAGLDHSATYSYDGAARLTAATVGGSGGYSFGYQYDGLQNMIERTAAGPSSLGALLGTYRYAESGAGPRQLSSVLKPDSSVHAFVYDAAGRLIDDGGTTLSYNGLDQLVSVLPAGASDAVEYTYGFDGLRTLTTHPDGTVERWFAESLREIGKERHHYIRAGDRTVARVTMFDTSGGGGGGGSIAIPPLSWRVAGLALILVFVGVLAALGRRRPGRPAHALAAAAILLAATSSCGLFGFGEKSVWVHQETLYFHHGVAPGPVMMTRDDGTVFSERRYEPFGQPIDNFEELVGGGTQTGPIDFLAEPLNSLNKPTDPTTGFSYHGARWMASQTARWLTPDPIVKAPDPKFMSEPWGLHPYQYVEQNPVLYWDPDGRDKRRKARVPNRREEPQAWEAWKGLKSGTLEGRIRAHEYAFFTEKAAFGGQLREWGVRGLRVDPNFESRGIVGQLGNASLKDFKEGKLTLGLAAFESRVILQATLFHEALHIKVGRQDIADGINPLHGSIHPINHALIYGAEIRYLQEHGAKRSVIARFKQRQRMYLGQIKDPVARKLARRGEYAEAKKRVVTEQPSARLDPRDDPFKE
jgi:RHS repeat-associated protein